MNATTVESMHLHLGGSKHTKKCHSSGHPDLIFIKEKNRLEVLSSGVPVIRKGFKAPKRSGTSGSKVSASNAAENGTAEVGVNGVSRAAENGAFEAESEPGELPPLPEGWEEHHDPNSGLSYYWNPGTQSSTWVRPEAPQRAEPEPQSPEPQNPAPQPLEPEILEPQKPEPRNIGLPPGWQAVPVQDDPDRVYYADIETQAAQWDPPPHYEQLDWERHVDPEGNAYWRSIQKNIAFYETDASWKRLMDPQQVVYWSNKEIGLRFFEPECGS
mmetsp:Transcript_26637/g.60710  ORF Transcript_26637/g.60710 Transcript_26637/m.60710 type:complete len:271 (-) Transcript_26637:101-913(-)